MATGYDIYEEPVFLLTTCYNVYVIEPFVEAKYKCVWGKKCVNCSSKLFY